MARSVLSEATNAQLLDELRARNATTLGIVAECNALRAAVDEHVEARERHNADLGRVIGERNELSRELDKAKADAKKTRGYNDELAAKNDALNRTIEAMRIDQRNLGARASVAEAAVLKLEADCGDVTAMWRLPELAPMETSRLVDAVQHAIAHARTLCAGEAKAHAHDAAEARKARDAYREDLRGCEAQLDVITGKLDNHAIPRIGNVAQRVNEMGRALAELRRERAAAWDVLDAEASRPTGTSLASRIADAFSKRTELGRRLARLEDSSRDRGRRRYIAEVTTEWSAQNPVGWLTTVTLDDGTKLRDDANLLAIHGTSPTRLPTPALVQEVARRLTEDRTMGKLVRGIILAATE